ncbi:ABC transporter ATP-binding protein [Mesobacillus zeae]|uniref:ABC transporter ATP-binding protein n=1 Tax=Mesobacillus zeae TaxID=1917180 RepID=A0A398BEM3_9BACI|nr:ABC transporter ATP-binding protein [Mesobacillus zeae]RID88789.1 ABC transporter ATP-binding protein [Mesobacillus zeae]
MPVIEVDKLFKEYKTKNGEKKVALNGVSFDVHEGEVFGLLGPNGAGKTTTIKILSTLLLPTRGSASVLGIDVIRNGEQVRSQINFVYGGEKGVYGRLTAFEYLSYFCVLYRIPRKQQKLLIDELITMVGLEHAEGQQIYTYSKGMIQRLHIARSLINDPKVIFLDEPTIGLDPVGSKMLRELIKSLSKKGITFILTTHYMSEADELCDRIVFLKNGSMSSIGTPKQIKEECNDLNVFEATIQLFDQSGLENEELISVNDLQHITESYKTIKLEFKKNLDISELENVLKKYCQVIKIQRKEISLEDAYIYLMKDVE